MSTTATAAILAALILIICVGLLVYGFLTSKPRGPHNKDRYWR